MDSMTVSLKHEKIFFNEQLKLQQETKMGAWEPMNFLNTDSRDVIAYKLANILCLETGDEQNKPSLFIADNRQPKALPPMPSSCCSG
jgi:hypothetical protein